MTEVNMATVKRDPIRLSMWTVYDHPSDFPDLFIARRWEVGEGLKEPLATAEVMATVSV